ncbi:MAG: hypothetical protein HOH95_14365 [Dehalococcoidia bacterium]|nr:hypothetical protein [Dehalococcoidia bacterium]
MTADVLKAAETDKTDTQARIKNLREEIEFEEARIEEIDGFLKMFKEYEAAGSATPGRQFHDHTDQPRHPGHHSRRRHDPTLRLLRGRPAFRGMAPSRPLSRRAVHSTSHSRGAASSTSLFRGGAHSRPFSRGRH